MIEVWKDIIGYEGLYQVSNLGNVRTLNYKHTGKITILKPINSGIGYYQVCLYKKGKRIKKYVHRLVAESFIPNPNEYNEINHKDECKRNNTVDNLEWCDTKYNLNYGTRKERMRKSLSKKVYCVELDKTFDSLTEAAEITGLNKANICGCCKGKYKTSGGYHWQYINYNL